MERNWLKRMKAKITQIQAGKCGRYMSIMAYCLLFGAIWLGLHMAIPPHARGTASELERHTASETRYEVTSGIAEEYSDSELARHTASETRYEVTSGIAEEYSATTMQDRAEKYQSDRAKRVRDLGLPATFTHNEAEFFLDIMIGIRLDSGIGLYETKVYMSKYYSEWTDQIVAYLTQLGYTVDTESNMIYWD